MSRLVVRFCALFGLCAAVCVFLSNSSLADRIVHEPLARLLATLSGLALSLLGPTVVEGPLLQFRAFTMEITAACDGVVPAYIFLAAVIAFPSTWSAKLVGTVLGLPVLFVINLLRIVSLMIMGDWRPDLFEQAHIYVWQVLTIGLSMTVWVFWIERCVRPLSRADA